MTTPQPTPQDMCTKCPCKSRKEPNEWLAGTHCDCACHLTPQPTKEAWFGEAERIYFTEGMTIDDWTNFVAALLFQERRTCKEKLEHLENAYKKMLAQKETQAQTYKQELSKKISLAAQELWDKGMCIAKRETESIIRHALLDEDKI